MTAIEEDISKMIKKRRKSVSESESGRVCVRACGVSSVINRTAIEMKADGII